MNIDIDLCGLFVEFYNSKKIKDEVFIPDTKVAKLVMNGLYKQFLKEGILVPIEKLPMEDKMLLVKECRMMKEVFYTNENLIEYCKILHVINLINNNS